MKKIMAVNAGSSSLKFQLLAMPEEKVIVEGIVERIGFDDAGFTFKYQGNKEKTVLPVKDHGQAVQLVLDTLIKKEIVRTLDEISGVGHRVLHCGDHYSDSVVIDEEVVKVIDDVSDLGPLHNPANLTGIKAFQKALPKAIEVAVFDTSFHLTMPEEAYLYAVPYEWYTKYGVRRYGFHGTSHKYVSREAARFLGKPVEQLRLITVHLGNGCSLAAVKYGKCVDTSMGLTPLEGIAMGTRSGSIDPAIVGFIASKEHKTAEEVVRLLNKESGYLGVSGISSDARDLRKAVEVDNNKMAKLAIDIQNKGIVDYIARYYVYMGGADAIIFTAGIGERSPETRQEVCERLKEALGVRIDPEKNKAIWGIEGEISTPDSKIKVLVVPTNEELAIARDVVRLSESNK
jgi:acetate kinase